MSEPSKAVFLSYASQDAEAAARICAALRAGGLEVWFDQSELRGGDAWDQKIRRQIRECALFIPIISAHAQARPEGYFRIEWRLADLRTHQMGRSRPFIVPACVDDTPETDADVPDSFSAVQWTHLPAAGTPSAFVERVARLLSPNEPASPARARMPADAVSAPTPPSASSAQGRIAERSICVLPFVNMSGDPEQEYFSDGLSEELLNQLAQMKGLNVAARTSCFAFKGQNPDLKVVSERLGVAHVLEGSVRKSGNRLRITAQLIKAADGYHLWSNTFNRELDDVFAIQEDIARAVAEALKVTLGMNESTLAPGVTRNVEAYDLYLRAQAFARQSGAQATNRAIALLREAVTVDPSFTMAWIGLASSYMTASLFAPESAEESRKLGEEALEKATASAPEAWIIHATQGTQLFLGRRDWIGAQKAYDRAVQIARSDASTVSTYLGGAGLAFFFASVGRTAESIECYRAIVRTDPLAMTEMYQFALDSVGRYEEAEADYKRTAALPKDVALTEYFALLRTMARGGSEDMKAQFRRYVALKDQYLPVHEEVLAHLDDKSAVLALLRTAFGEPFYQHNSRMAGLAYFAAKFGDEALALACLRRAFVDMRGITVAAIWHPLFAHLRTTDGFKDLVRDLGLYDYWRHSGHWSDFTRAKGNDDFECW